MITIQSRVAECKSMQPIHTRQEASDKVTRDVELFLANGGSITPCDSYQANFKSPMAKDRIAREEAKRRKAVAPFRGDNK